MTMRKYSPLWAYTRETGDPRLRLTFAEIERIAGVPIDHSFLHYRKELLAYGYQVEKISLKEQSVLFCKAEGDG